MRTELDRRGGVSLRVRCGPVAILALAAVAGLTAAPRPVLAEPGPAVPAASDPRDLPGGDVRKHSVEVPRVAEPPRIEDYLDMRPPPGAGLARVEGFVQQVPEDGAPASQHTEVYLGYDDDHLHAVFLAFDDEPDRVRAHYRRREDIFGDEIVEIMLDTYGDGQRAYAFVVTPLGTQWDAIWTEGTGFDDSWDTVWRSEGRLTDRGYVVRMAIPFKSLRFPTGDDQRWGLIFVRDIPRNNESSFWPRVSSRIDGRLNQAGTLTGLRDIAPGRNVQLIPYATASRYRALDPGRADFERDSLDPEVGLDAKLVLQDRLALDLTANPDFSQVESDAPQVTVNSRFEVFFPEKRPFFLENAGFFQTPIDLLFTRRIADPRVGGRLTGKVGPFALGALLIDDEAPGERVPAGDLRSGDAAAFGIVRLRRDLPRQSYAGLIYTERRFEGDTNRVGGFDGRFRLDANWDTRLQAVWSRTRTADRDASGTPLGTATELSDPSWTVMFNRSARRFTAHVHYQDFGPEFRTETGFVPRVDLRDAHAQLNYKFWPEKRRLISVDPGLYVQRITDHRGTRLDEVATASVAFDFRRQTGFSLFATAGQERLRREDMPQPELAAALGVDALDFRHDGVGANASTSFVRSVTLGARVEVGTGINFVPPPGELPAAADVASGSLELGLRPGRRLQLDATWLWTRLDGRDGGGRIFTNSIARTRWGWQFDPRLSVRLILQHELTRPEPGRTRLERDERWNGDVLVSYIVNPLTALYVGYTTNYSNVEIVEGPGGPAVVRTPDRLMNDARQWFVKLSYLFRP